MTAKTRHTIELKGKRYDAQTGKFLGSSRVPNTTRAHTKPAAHNLQRQPERSKTLMRHAVKKPTTLEKTAKSHTPVLVPHAGIDHKRLVRAKHAQKSKRISKFGSRQSAVQPTPAVLPVRPEPATPPPFNPVRHEAPSRHTSHRPDFHKALHNATSHTQPNHKKANRRRNLSHKLRISPRIINVTAASLVLITLAGFFAWQNAPRLSIHLASAQANVNGSLPSYTPSGFSLSGPIKYDDGQISITYKSRTDNRTFTIHQRNTAWNPDSLEQNYLKENVLSYQVLKEKGQTIYIYNGTDATWTANNTWYQIEGDSSLSSDQLIRLASSM